MNSKTKILLLFCVQLFICSCWFIEPYVYDGAHYIKEPYYINNSGVPVRIYMRWVSSNVFSYSYGYVQNGDTLHRTFQIPESYEDTTVFNFPNDYWYMYPDSKDENCGLTYGFYCKNPFFIMLQFLDEPTNCLKYSGPIQNNPTDIRSWKAYDRGDTIPGASSKEYFVNYFYTITPQHKAMATEEDCHSSAGE